jgi:hypothetical protein
LLKVARITRPICKVARIVVTLHSLLFRAAGPCQRQFMELLSVTSRRNISTVGKSIIQ